MFFFSSRRRNTRFKCDWSSDVCSSDLQLVEDWLANPPPTVTSDITRTKHRDAAVRINAALGHVPALKLDADMVEALLRGMADDGFATKTIVMTRSVLVRSLNRGQRNKLLTQNVASLVPCPRGTVRQSNALNTNQVRRLLADLTPWWKAWVTIGCMLGFHPLELLVSRNCSSVLYDSCSQFATRFADDNLGRF